MKVSLYKRDGKYSLGNTDQNKAFSLLYSILGKILSQSYDNEYPRQALSLLTLNLCLSL